MQPFSLTLSLALVANAAYAQRPASLPVDSVVQMVDAMVERAYAIGATPALGVAVIIDGRTVYERSVGVADVSAGTQTTRETLWYVASTSKSFAGFGVALLEAAGQLDVRAPITRVLPNAKWHPEAKADELDLISFLTHTHGLDGGGPVVMSAAFSGSFPESRFGELTAYHAPSASRALQYSNFGYNVAAMAIDARYPHGWKAFLRDSVFRPAGMHNTFASTSDVRADRIAMPHRLTANGTFTTRPFPKRDITMNAAGGHLSTLSDLARWVAAHMNNGILDGRRVFPERVVRRTHENLGRRDATFAFFQREGWGMGWDIGRYEADAMVSRFGSYNSLRSHLSFLPERRVGVVAQANGQPGWPLTDVIAAYVYDLVNGRADAERRATERLTSVRSQLERAKQAAVSEAETRAARQRLLPRPLSDYTGRFDNRAYGRLIIDEVRDTLRVTWGVLRGDAEVFQADSSQLRVELRGSGDVLTFRFAGRGPATEVQLGSIAFQRAR